MPGHGLQLGQPRSRKDQPKAISEELRGWIERVIVPALVTEYLRREKQLPEEGTDG